MKELLGKVGCQGYNTVNVRESRTTFSYLLNRFGAMSPSRRPSSCSRLKSGDVRAESGGTTRSFGVFSL